MRNGITYSRQIDESGTGVGIDVGGIHAPHKRVADGPARQLLRAALSNRVVSWIIGTRRKVARLKAAIL